MSPARRQAKSKGEVVLFEMCGNNPQPLDPQIPGFSLLFCQIHVVQYLSSVSWAACGRPVTTRRHPACCMPVIIGVTHSLGLDLYLYYCLRPELNNKWRSLPVAWLTDFPWQGSVLITNWTLLSTLCQRTRVLMPPQHERCWMVTFSKQMAGRSWL